MLSELIDKDIFPSALKRHQTTEPNQSIASNIGIIHKSISISRQAQIIYSLNSEKLQNDYQQPQFVRHSSSKLSEFTPANNTCQQCGKSFLKNAHLLRHMNERHSDNRSFICNEPQCGKTFKRDSHLRRHMISHTQEKKFKCSQCIMAFGYKHHLDRHVKTVHEKILLKCEDCGQTFAKKKPFLKHVEKKHSKTTKNKQQKNQKDSNIKGKLQMVNSSNESKTTKTKKIRKHKEKIKELQQNHIQIDKDQHQSSNSMFSSEQSYSSQSQNSSVCSVKKDKIVNKKVKQQMMLFRCVYSDCVSAFGRMHELMRHMKQKHKEYGQDQKEVNDIDN